MRSLRARLVVLTLLLLGGALASLTVVSGRLNIDGLRAARRHESAGALGAIRDALQPLLRDSLPMVPERLEQLARLANRRLLLLDPNRHVIASAPSPMREGEFSINPEGELDEWTTKVPDSGNPGPRMTRVARVRVVGGGAPGASIIDAKGRPLAMLYDLTAQGSMSADIAPTFESYRPFAIAAVAVALIAALITLLLARRVLAPIERLTAAARRLAAGDLTERVAVRGHDEIAELGGAFNTMADALTRNERLRRAMTNDIAHELRTPLTNIRCIVESIADEVVAPSTDVMVGLQDEVLLLQRLIEDLQDVSLAEVGELRLRREPVNAGEELNAAARALQREAMLGDVTLRVTPGDCRVLADRERLQQVLRNLVRNAITHTLPGGAVQLSVQTLEEARMAEFAVSDSGMGIATDHLDDIFQRFYRVDSSRARATGGAGLGLAIVRSLTEAQGGQVAVDSEVGRGSTFRFTLPLAPS